MAREDSKTYFSNRVELLYGDLVINLFRNSHPFERRLVIVPSPAMKSWLTLRMAEDPALKICSGLEILFLEEGIERLYSSSFTSDSPHYLPSPLELALAIESRIKKTITAYNQLSDGEKEIWRPLVDYLQASPGKRLLRRSERRLTALATALSQLFRQYGLSGRELLTEWERDPKGCWQAHLFKSLYAGGDNPYSHPYRKYTSCRIDTKSPPLQLHLFAVTYLSALQFRFVEEARKQHTAHHYLLSPSALFWSDIRSDRERLSIVKSWRKKGISGDEEKQLEELLRDRNPLLANFGRLGREMVQEVEESCCHCIERYIAPKAIEGHPHYGDHYSDAIAYEEKGGPLTLLQALQADMLTLRTPKKGEPIDLKRDASIELNICPNKLREVEVLYDRIAAIIDRAKSSLPPITPSDVVVLAPDIAEYQPYIEATFGSKESRLDYRLMDLKAPLQYRLVQAFLHMLALPRSRWESTIVLELFEYPPFHKKHNITLDDIHLFRGWIEKSDIRWGQSADHRDEILSSQHARRGMVERSGAGTWERGLTALLRTIACGGEEGEELFAMKGEVSITEAETLGKVCHLMRSLLADLSVAAENSLLTLVEWRDYLTLLLESYFAEEEGETALLLEKFKLLAAPSRFSDSAKEERYPFTAVESHLMSALEQQHTSYREHHLQAVKFCSMLPMRAIPSRVVALIGMEEGAFPKQEQHLSLNKLNGAENIDYTPSQIDYDRYLFLEILLSARDNLLLSHSSLTLAEDSALPPSLILAELINYLDLAYRIEGALPSTLIANTHPFRSFDSAYFRGGSELQSFSKKGYLAAKSFYSPKKKEPHRFLEHFSMGSCEVNGAGKEPLFIEVKELVKAMRNPLKLYFNKRLRIYIQNAEDQRLKVEEHFSLSPLQLSAIRKAALLHPAEKIMREAEKGGLLPLGLFKEAAVDKSMGEIEEIQKLLSDLSIGRGDITSLTFSEECEKPSFDEGQGWLLPPLTCSLDEYEAVITGTLSSISPKGLLTYCDDKPEGIFKYWAEFLLLGAAIEKHSLPIEWALIPYKEKKDKRKKMGSLDPLNMLKHFIDLYIASLNAPSPLIPEWICSIVKGEEKELEKTVRDTLKNSFQPLYNDYLEWAISMKNAPSAKAMIDAWHAPAKRALAPPLSAWFPKKLKCEEATAP